MPAISPRPTFAELYVPKLITVLREGYGIADLRADAVAGLTVAIVALPLSMAIAIASGVTPDRGLTAAIVGGLVISALGGSRFQIGGPAGAFIVLVSVTVAEFGVEGLALATILAGCVLVAPSMPAAARVWEVGPGNSDDQAWTIRDGKLIVRPHP